MSKYLHENENYGIYVGDAEYEAVNLNTGVVETTNKSLPTIISEVEQMNAYLVNALWKWIGVSTKEQAYVEEDVIEFEAAIAGKDVLN